MIRIQQLKVPLAADDASREVRLENKIRKELQLSPDQPLTYEIRKCSIDARKKPELFYVYTVDVCMRGEGRLVKKLHRPNIVCVQEKRYHFPKHGDEPLKHPPVVVGAGPAGLFCAYELALHGYRPLLVERGRRVEERTADVAEFWESGVLKPDSNVQFGEGGAGTFSDGKLNTMVKDPDGRGRHVLELLCKFGAPPEILYESRPHIGTDILTAVIRNMREEIRRLGGRFFFQTKLIDLLVSDGRLTGVVVRTPQGSEKTIHTQTAVIAVGHSARDTFARLHALGLVMEPKAFAVGFRVERHALGEAFTSRRTLQGHRKYAGRARSVFVLHVPGRLCGQCLLCARTAGGQRHEQLQAGFRQRERRGHCLRDARRFSGGRPLIGGALPAAARGTGLPPLRRKHTPAAVRRF